MRAGGSSHDRGTPFPASNGAVAPVLAKSSIEWARLIRNRAAAIVLLLLTVAVFAACGSESDRESGTPNTDGNGVQPTTAPPLPTPEPIIDLEDADEALQEGRFEEAAEAFTAFAEAASDDRERARAHLSAGVGWYQAGDVERSVSSLRAAYDAAPTDSQIRRRAGYLLGERLAERGDFEEAANALQPLYSEAVGDALQPYIDAAFAQAAANAGAADIADEAWDRAMGAAATPDSLRIAILRERIEIARDEGDLDLAAARLTELLDLASSSADHFALADVAVNRGDRATWETQMRRLVADYPASRHALLAIEVLERHRVEVNSGLIGYVYYRHGQYASARDVLADSLDEPGLEAGQLAFRTFYLAASHDDAGLYEESIPIYEAAAAHDPESPFAHRARYWAARSAEAIGDLEDAVRRYIALVNDDPEGEFAPESAFRAGYMLLQAGDPEGAAAAWEQLEAVTDARTLYWQARAYEDTGNGERAAETYERLMADHAFTFHGLEAAERLGIREPAQPVYSEVHETPAPDWDAIATWLAGGEVTQAPPAATTPADDFAGVGLYARARQALNESDAEPLARLRAAWELGLTDTAARIATTLIQSSGEEMIDIPLDIVRLAYPLRYVAYLDALGAHHGFDPLFLAALIRTESFWDPGARSHADARGLTQVIPTTGDLIAAALDDDDWVAGDLFRPNVSLQYGAFYLGEQLDRFNDPYLALAAYNAGPGNALRWGELAGDASPPELVEIVDFAETRSYLRLVMSAYAVYEYAYREHD